MPEPITNQRPFPNFGTGISYQEFQKYVSPWITKAEDLSAGVEVINRARASINDPHQELQAVIWARGAGNWHPAAEATLTARINELTKFIHGTEGGPIRFP